MTFKIVLENLKHKPMRSLLSVLLIGVPVTLILALVGASHGLSQDAQNRARGSGADVLIRGSSASSVVSASGAPIDERLVPKMQEQPHVRLAMGVIVHPLQLPLNVMGIDLDKFNQMSGGFTYLAGGPFQNPDDILIDQYYATQTKKWAGDTLRLLNRDWYVRGVIGSGKLAHIVVQKKLLQELDSATGRVSGIYLKLDDPANADRVAAQLRELLPNYIVNTMEELTSMFSPSNIQGVKEFTAVVIGIGVVIGFAVVCLSMYMAVLQRTREIGILKSLGGSNGFILRIILVEALLLGVGGTILGILLSYGAYWIIRTFIPASFPMVIVYAWWPRALVITLVATGLGALYPGLNAARHDPIEALAYE